MKKTNNHIGSDREINLNGKELVSMNMWGFTPVLFDYLESMFIEFLNINTPLAVRLESHTAGLGREWSVAPPDVIPSCCIAHIMKLQPWQGCDWNSSLLRSSGLRLTKRLSSLISSEFQICRSGVFVKSPIS